MLYSPDEMAWITRMVTEYADQSGYRDRMAVSMVMSELTRLQAKPAAPVIPIGRRVALRAYYCVRRDRSVYSLDFVSELDALLDEPCE